MQSIKVQYNYNYNFHFGGAPLNRVAYFAGLQNTIKAPGPLYLARGFFISNRSLIPDYKKLQTSVTLVKQAYVTKLLFIASFVSRLKTRMIFQWCWKQHDGIGYPSIK